MGAWRGVRGVVVSQFFLFTWIPGSLVSWLVYVEMDMDVNSQQKAVVEKINKNRAHVSLIVVLIEICRYA